MLTHCLNLFGAFFPHTYLELHLKKKKKAQDSSEIPNLIWTGLFNISFVKYSDINITYYIHGFIQKIKFLSMYCMVNI